MTKTINKIHKPITTYEEIISNLIYRKRWKKGIEEKLKNLEDYHA